MIITLISDTHTKHNEITKDLPGGDLIIHAGDISSMGYLHEIKNFCKWFEMLPYDHCVFIAGNHDFGFQDSVEDCKKILEEYSGIDYLQDDLYLLGKENDFYSNKIKIYGSPWQPEFCNWAFNLPRNGEQLYQRWNNISEDTDILITHGPAIGHLDQVFGRTDHLGCQLLANRIEELRTKIHICGHIHSGYGYKFYEGTHYFNASVLNEQYKYTNKPFTFNWDKKSNTIEFL